MLRTKREQSCRRASTGTCPSDEEPVARCSARSRRRRRPRRSRRSSPPSPRRSRCRVDDERDDTLHEWVRAARLRSHRAGLQRGPWRLSGRIGRRSRALMRPAHASEVTVAHAELMSVGPDEVVVTFTSSPGERVTTRVGEHEVTTEGPFHDARVDRSRARHRLRARGRGRGAGRSVVAGAGAHAASSREVGSSRPSPPPTTCTSARPSAARPAIPRPTPSARCSRARPASRRTPR